MADVEPTRNGMVGRGLMALAMHGAIAAGLALAIGVDASLGFVALILAALAEMVVFFVATAYVDVIGERYDHPEQPMGERIMHGTRNAAMLLLGGLPVLVVFGMEELVGVDDDGSATDALVALTILLGGFGYVAAQRGQSSRTRAAVEALVVALIGVGILVLKLTLR